MANSQARDWMEQSLKAMKGRRVQWPQLLRDLLVADFEDIRIHGEPYTQNVFIDRDSRAAGHKSTNGQDREKLLVYKLYRAAHVSFDGAINVGNTPVWLISVEVPNQGRHRGRRADLLGLRRDGSLVVFEAKRAGNRSDTPFHGVLEGIDYLSHLLIDQNVEKLIDGFEKWRRKHGRPNVYSKTPAGFEDVQINPSVTPAVVVVGPESYFDLHRLDAKGFRQDWEWISDRCWPRRKDPFEIDFALCDFQSQHCPLLDIQQNPHA